MRPTDQLRESVKQEWEAATNHKFCKELAEGTLPLKKMRWYLVQDYKFVDQFVRLLATAIAHAPTLADGVPGAQFLGMVTSTENTYFLRSFEALKVSQDEQSAPAAPPTRTFQDIMEAARHSGRYEEMLAVLVVAEWSYLTWADRYTDYYSDLPFWYSEWIDLHSGAYFESVVAYFRDQLDAIWNDLSESRKERTEAIFQEAVRCEVALFDAAYAIGD